MATSGYVGEIQPAAQPQGAGVTVTVGQPDASSSPAIAPQFLAEIQTTVATPTVVTPTGQTTPTDQATSIITQKPADVSQAQSTAQAQPPQTQYVTAEIQGSPTQSGNAQSTPQYIVVTVTEGSLHSSDSLSDSSPPPAVVQTGVPTQVVQQVQAAQQRSVVQATSQIAKTEPGTQLSVTSLQPVHIQEVQQQLTPVPVQHVYANQVQYVEEGETNYTSTIRSSAFPYTDTPLYTQTTAAQYYEGQPTSGSQASTPGTPLTVSVTAGTAGGVSMFVAQPTSAAGGGATVVTTGGTTNGAGEGAGTNGGAAGSYVIQGGYMLGSSGGGGGGGGAAGNSQNYSHTTRASPATVSITEGEEGSVPSADKKVQWLLDNYETAEGVSLPRSTLYCHYLLHCQEQKLEPVNAASFGKLIRSVFMGLRTRRLGTRGNSKYHYYGLRIKAGSSLLRLMEDQQHLAMRQQPFSQKQRLKPVHKVEGLTNGTAAGAGQQQQQQQGSGQVDISTQVQQYQQFLDASRALPDFPDIDLQGKSLPEGIELEHIKSFQLLYREHCEAILDVMVNLQFTLVETLWKTFWRFSQNQAGDATLAVHDESEKRLPKSCLVILCKYDPVLRWSRDCDNCLYQGLVEILIPDVLRPIPSALTQAIRNFAKSLESWLTNAMMNIPEEMVRIKVTSANAFAQTLRRYTSLNHLAQAARAVLQNTAQINQMLSDLNRVDFANVQEQASWVCRCEDRVVQRLEQDFKLTLQQQNSLEQWAAWLDGVVSQVLKPYQQSPAFPKAAKLFLLKWSFYSSMVIRDLTLRSAASFGSFHLIRLLYDEYMYYLIEHRVAQAKGETPIAVMGEFASLGRGLHQLDPDKEEEEEEDDESDDEGQELSLPSDAVVLGDDSLEPPAKLARMDQRVLFTTGSADD
ncbi:MHC class II regulatory factor RFX1a [Anarrhichthys ocellatus]|uniref:MHC class II regulatory factor RFX1a n=1 Tax=Anarrhichthys ocellatus TaxID=433405 RepID=UPI0012ED2D00|nr:MHC class II regulatory factor RFX1-like [Anarrhichthys ocellatus]XP_031728036.1 MHC class II regulatory factor RFX1-like [Anarrhichthys ocellatus]XP_031728037.1 MHC class II regulatory factor RFX1-like [Anarrhichthys ocellatus]XP_031728038.1 MHC class II regulatory factor RFX1-like [Anarrhichthys ocellatus]